MDGHWAHFGGLLLSSALVLGCAGEDGHAPFIGDQVIEPSCDAGDCGGGKLGPPERSLECLPEDVAKDFGHPLSGTVERFDSDYFHPLETAAVDGAYELKALGAPTNSLACATGTSGQAFELFGGTEKEGGLGPLLITPKGHEAFWPTMIHRAPTRDVDVGRVPVFGAAQIAKIFKDTGVKPNPEKSHIVIEFTFVDDTMMRTRFGGIKLSSGAAEAIAFRVGSSWTTDATESDSNGLGVLLNVNASSEGLGIQVDAHYVNTGSSPDAESIPIDGIWSYAGAVTYVALTPQG